MIHKRYPSAALAALLLLNAGPAPAVIRLVSPFGEHMVLQQGAPVPISGGPVPVAASRQRFGDR